MHSKFILSYFSSLVLFLYNKNENKIGVRLWERPIVKWVVSPTVRSPLSTLTLFRFSLRYSSISKRREINPKTLKPRLSLSLFLCQCLHMHGFGKLIFRHLLPRSSLHEFDSGEKLGGCHLWRGFSETVFLWNVSYSRHRFSISSFVKHESFSFWIL